MKKLWILAALVLSVGLGGCSSKTPVSTEDFSRLTKEAGFICMDISDQYDPGQAAAVMAAERDDAHMDLFVLHDVEDAAATFAINRQNLEPLEGGSVTTSASMSNYSSYTLTTSDTYYVVSRVGETVLYVEADKGSKKEISDLIKSMGH